MSELQQQEIGSELQREVRSEVRAGLGAKILRALPWATKGGLAIVDQGLISGSNFLLGILLARWLAPEQYGAYALAFSAFLLLTFLYQALLLEPMAVFSGAAYRKSLRGYLGALLWIHLVLSVVVVVVLGAATAIAYHWEAVGHYPRPCSA